MERVCCSGFFVGVEIASAVMMVCQRPTRRHKRHRSAACSRRGAERRMALDVVVVYGSARGYVFANGPCRGVAISGSWPSDGGRLVGRHSAREGRRLPAQRPLLCGIADYQNANVQRWS